MAPLAYNLPTDNVAPNATWAEEASGDTAYPASNVPDFSDLNRGNPGKLTIATAGGWTADFGAAQRVDLVVLQHNADVNQPIQVQMNATNSWGSPTMTMTITAPAKREDGFTTKLFVDMTKVSGYSASGLRWLRIHFPLIGGSTPNSQNWGLKVWVGNILRVLDRPLEAEQVNAEHHTVLKLSTDFGYTWSYDLQTAPRSLTGRITAIQATTWPALLSMFRAAAGSAKPMVVIPNPSINDAWIATMTNQQGSGFSRQGVLEDELPVTAIAPLVMPVPVGWTELHAGGPEWT